MMFVKDSANSHGFVDPHVIEQKWKDHFSYLYREERDFVMPITIHPDVSGRPRGFLAIGVRDADGADVLMMLERFIKWVNTHEGVEWVTMAEIAEDFRSKNQPPSNARMPKGA
jgi:hypothetical protein